jgi:hypothetical protein
MSQETLRMVCFANVHSVMSYGIIFWGNLPYSEKTFKIQKKVIGILQIQDLETRVGNCLKKWKYCPILSIYFFFINVCN